jgi:hypothetical protein
MPGRLDIRQQALSAPWPGGRKFKCMYGYMSRVLCPILIAAGIGQPVHTYTGAVMERERMQRSNFESDEMNEKVRREVMKTLEPHGLHPVGDLGEMSEGERVKWLFWNLHENLDALRRLEPTLIGQVTSTQFTVSDGQSMSNEKCGLEKRIELACRWRLLLTYTHYQNEENFEMGEGSVNLFVGQPPRHPALKEGQKGFIDADSSLFPNQLFMYGWVTDEVWREIKPQLYSDNPTCRSDILLLDNFLFPVKEGFDFVTGPPGSIGITNLEFRLFSHTTERRMVRRTEPRQRS